MNFFLIIRRNNRDWLFFQLKLMALSSELSLALRKIRFSSQWMEFQSESNRQTRCDAHKQDVLKTESIL